MSLTNDQRAEGLRFEGTLAQGSFAISGAFSAAPGARIAVMGPSGAGKSTLLAGLAGFLPVLGSLTWQGVALGDVPPAKRPMSLLFQDHNLLPHLSVFDNAALGISPALRLSAEQREGVAQALERVGLGDLGARKPGQLSGGQISRAGLARVLLRARPWILLDEPFAALGPALKRDMLALVGDIAQAQGAGVIMVTHDPGDARALCPQTIVVADGQIAPPRDTGALLESPPEALRDYL